MTRQLKRGNSQSGFTFVELLWVIVLLGILTSFLGISVRSWLNSSQYRCERTAKRLAELFDEKRTAAKNGLSAETDRTVNLTTFQLGDAVEWVQENKTGSLPPGIQYLPRPDAIEFEQQSGRTVGGINGMLVIQDTRTGQKCGIFVSRAYSPTSRYVMYPGWEKYEPAPNAVR